MKRFRILSVVNLLTLISFQSNEKEWKEIKVLMKFKIQIDDGRANKGSKIENTTDPAESSKKSVTQGETLITDTNMNNHKVLLV